MGAGTLASRPTALPTCDLTLGEVLGASLGTAGVSVHVDPPEVVCPAAAGEGTEVPTRNQSLTRIAPI